MGLMLGKILAETPKYRVLQTTADYEIRLYAPSVMAQVTYDPAQFKSEKDGAFALLVNYFGVFGKPQNSKPETKIAMTTPVITKTPSTSGEKIGMTTPVVTKSAGGESKAVTMQFTLPSQYTKAEEAPTPADERVVIREEAERKFGVLTFRGAATEEVVKRKVEMLKGSLRRDGHKATNDHLLGRYNPPWLTLAPLRTNEVLIPVE